MTLLWRVNWSAFDFQSKPYMQSGLAKNRFFFHFHSGHIFKFIHTKFYVDPINILELHANLLKILICVKCFWKIERVFLKTMFLKSVYTISRKRLTDRSQIFHKLYKYIFLVIDWRFFLTEKYFLFHKQFKAKILLKNRKFFLGRRHFVKN